VKRIAVCPPEDICPVCGCSDLVLHWNKTYKRYNWECQKENHFYIPAETVEINPILLPAEEDLVGITADSRCWTCLQFYRCRPRISGLPGVTLEKCEGYMPGLDVRIAPSLKLRGRS